MRSFQSLWHKLIWLRFWIYKYGQMVTIATCGDDVVTISSNLLREDSWIEATCLAGLLCIDLIVRHYFCRWSTIITMHFKLHRKNFSTYFWKAAQSSPLLTFGNCENLLFLYECMKNRHLCDIIILYFSYTACSV